MPCKYEQKYTIKKRNLTRWGMDQLNNFMTKIFVFAKRCTHVPYKGIRVGDSVKTLKMPHTLCLIHMNRKGTIKRGIFQVGACTNLKYFMEKNHLSLV